MRFTFFVLMLWSIPPALHAGGLVVVDQPTPFDVGAIDDITVETVYLGELTGFPHTFDFIATEPFNFSVDILAPGTHEGPLFSGILVAEADRGVNEVARMPAAGASWGEFTDQIAGITYLDGPSYDAELPPGFYRFEISTPVNQGRYVLELGDQESGFNYFEALEEIYTIKRFLGHSRLSLLTSPLVYGPLLMVLLVGFIGYRWYKRNRADDKDESE